MTRCAWALLKVPRLPLSAAFASALKYYHGSQATARVSPVYTTRLAQLVNTPALSPAGTAASAATTGQT